MEPHLADGAAPPRRRGFNWRRLLFRAARTLLLSAVCLVLLIVLFEKRLIFMPTKYPDGDWEAPARSDLPLEDVRFRAADGVNLHGWFARGPGAKLTLLYLHGNAGNVSHRYEWLRALAGLPADVFLIDYRGYGRSEGSPDEEGIYLDAEAAYRYLTEQRGVKAQSLVLYGKSLGGAAACELALRQPCGALIVQSSFTSIRDMAGVMLPFFPAAWFLRTRFDNLEKVAKIATPKLFVHSRDDEMIPYRMSQRLHAAAAEPKQLVLFDGAGHNDLIWRHEALVIAAFRKFLRPVGL